MAPQTLAEKAKAKLQAVLEDPNRNDSSCTYALPFPLVRLYVIPY